MGDREKQQAAHLVVLVCCTIFGILLLLESMLLGWELSTALLILAGVFVCWWLHITKRLPQNVNLWIIVILTMIAFFFYGSHATSIYDLAAVMIFITAMYQITEKKGVINLCMITYYLTLLYDFVFFPEGFGETSPVIVTRILLHMVLVYVAGQVVKFAIKIQQDEKKDTEKKIMELKEANRRTEDFLTNVSHELRTPINAVTGITTTMLKTEGEARRRKDIFSIQMAGQRLFNQVEDILDFTELDTGHIKLSEDSYAVASLINDIINGSYFPETEDVPELIIDLDVKMPALLLGDGRKIKKVIKHLMDNGIKFTKVGGVFVKIYTIPKPYGVNLCIQVSDTGIGIAPEELERIKERFYQTNSGRNRKTGGLGLGLSIVCGMVSAMEGFVQIDSTLGKGTMVSVSIPQKVSDAAPHISLRDKDNLCVACFVEPEKYQMSEVRTFYNEMIADMVSGFGVPLRRVSNLDELKQTAAKYELTHLFVGKEEFLKYRGYLETLDRNLEIIVAANEKLPDMGRFKLMKKPFYCLPVANIVNAGNTKEGQEQEGSMSCPGVKVLVVDDEPMNLMVAEGIFKGYQMTVKTAKSGKEAIELCSQESFDLIFLDHMMPEMDGIETLKQLRKLHLEDEKPLTVIAFTANAVSGAREMFLDAGFNEFISKPIEYCELERVLRRTLPKSAIAYTSGKEPEEVLLAQTETYAEPVWEPEETAADSKDETKCLLEHGINEAAALQYCGGDKDFYREVLAKFSKDFGQKTEKLAEFFGKEDWDSYRIQIHALKSNAKLVGADELSEMAKAAEDAAKEHDGIYIKAHHQEIVEKYDGLAKAAAEILGLSTPEGEAKEPTGTAAGGDGAELTAEELEQKLSGLKDCLDTFEEDRAQEALKGLERFRFGDIPLQEQLAAIKRDVDEFEFEAAAQKTEELLQRVKGGEGE